MVSAECSLVSGGCERLAYTTPIGATDLGMWWTDLADEKATTILNAGQLLLSNQSEHRVSVCNTGTAQLILLEADWASVPSPSQCTNLEWKCGSLHSRDRILPAAQRVHGTLQARFYFHCLKWFPGEKQNNNFCGTEMRWIVAQTMGCTNIYAQNCLFTIEQCALASNFHWIPSIPLLCRRQ